MLSFIVLLFCCFVFIPVRVCGLTVFCVFFVVAIADRSLLFNRDFGESFDMTSPCDEKEPWQYSCYLCGLEDFSNRFVHYCDCGVQFHTRCSKARNLFVPSHESLCTQEEIKLYHDNWFCLYCINYASKICQYGRERLMKRRLQADGPEGEYEVDEVMSHDPNFEFYCVRWKYYPPQATSRIQFDASYAQKIDYYWGEWEVCVFRFCFCFFFCLFYDSYFVCILFVL